MHNLNVQIEEIQALVDSIQHFFIPDLEHNKCNYDKLLMLSEESNYSYGQALAHIHLAQYFHMKNQYDDYYFHLNCAKNIADSKNYSDIIIDFFKLSGFHQFCACNEIHALSLYLHGIKLAVKTNDRKSCAVFYTNIGDLYYESGAYCDAAQFYKKALASLEDTHLKDVIFYRKKILINLLDISCIQCDLKNASMYMEKCISLQCDTGNLPLLFMAAEIRLLLLEGKQDEAKIKTKLLKSGLRENHPDSILLQPVYFYLMDLFLFTKNKPAAAWCMTQINQLYPEDYHMHQKICMQIKKLHVQYAILMGLDSFESYQDFYQSTQMLQIKSRISTAESLKNLIDLYELNSEQAIMQAKRNDLQIAANLDELTQIYNRRYFDKLISKFLQDDRITSIGCIMVDVDYFKGYNDYYGHPKGDIALKTIAFLLHDNLPENAYASRYGGDEFLCLFTDTSIDSMTSYARTLLAKLAKKNILHEKNPHSHVLTLSLGIYYETVPDTCDELTLIKKADKALYQAKKSGRNTYSIYQCEGGTF